nr:reverse transcriptase domain-containing protein [Tanacetum cinerariifolium]
AHALKVTCSDLHEHLSRYENLTDRLEEFQDAQLKVVNDNVAKFDVHLAKMACHLEEKFYPCLLTTISDASVEDIMNLLRLEGPLADAPEQIRANIVAERSALLDVWTHLSEPLSVQNLIGEAYTSASVPASTVTTTALSITFASASFIPPITVDDYEIVHVDSHESSQGNVQGDVAAIKFEKEDLDTTPEQRENRSLGEGIKARLDEKRKNWIEEISHVLWAHRTMIKSSKGETPFSLTHGTEAVIPVEIGMPTLKTAEDAKSKAMMAKYYNVRVRSTSFKPGDLVYQSNEAIHTEDGGKLGPKWEGPYEVTEALGKGAYKLRDGNILLRT